VSGDTTLRADPPAGRPAGGEVDMVASPTEARPPALFASVASLEPFGADAAEKLRAVHRELVDLGARRDAERLVATADRAAERRDFTSLERLVAREHSLAELSEIQHGRVRGVVGWRNAAALVPLVTTWLLLGWASMSYQRLPGSDKRVKPFLLLWEERFGGASIPAFSHAALTVCVLLFVVLVLTVWAHQLESALSRVFADVATKMDDALTALGLAVQTSIVRAPISPAKWAEAAEWAEAAQRVLTETQRLITDAVRDTKALAERNNEISQTAKEAMAETQEQGRELVAGLAREVRETMAVAREDNAQLIARATEAAKDVLQQAGAANRKLVEEQMTPLFQGFRTALDAYRADQEVYRASAGELATAAAVLAGNSESHAEVAGSIDKHLRLIEASQTDFVTQVTEISQSMTTAATAMAAATTLITGRLRGDLETLARNVVDAGTELAAIDRGLARTTAALDATTLAMERSAVNLAAATAARRRWRFFRLFRRNR
jgi:hypothetical protein